MFQRSLGFDDVVLVPRVISKILSRNNIDTSVKFNEKLTIKTPIIASPMQDVCNAGVASEMNRLGGLGIIHRFMSIKEQVEEYKQANCFCACAIGVDGDYYDRFLSLMEVGCNIYCLDVANGGNIKVERAIEKISDENIDIIVGNVSSAQCYEWLEQFDKVKAQRCGIANGYSCATKNATGIEYGMVSAIQECAAVKKRTLLIADGGIKEPSDFCKAIAFGADLVMMGGVIAATCDSPAEIVKKDDKLYKVYHGSASFEVQKCYKEKPRYIEGKTRLLDFNNESLESLISRYCEGLRSSMSYFNSSNLEEFRENMSFAVKGG